MQTKGEGRRDAPRASEDAEALVLGGCKRSLGRWFGVGRVGLGGPEGQAGNKVTGVGGAGGQPSGLTGMNLGQHKASAWWSRKA